MMRDLPFKIHVSISICMWEMAIALGQFFFSANLLTQKKCEKKNIKFSTLYILSLQTNLADVGSFS